MDDNNIYDYKVESGMRSNNYGARVAGLTFPALMQKVYMWMFLALVMTGLTAFGVASNESLVYSIVTNQALFWGLIIGEFALVIILTSCIHRLSFLVAGLMFALYGVVNGATLSVIFLAYTASSIASTFFICAGMFGAMSLTGLFVKRDLSTVGRFLFMALIGLIIASVVNIFIASSALDWCLTFVGVFIFCGLTAYDTQKMKYILQQSEGMGEENMMKIALMCSLSLYLDFINLFLYLLRIFGDRK